MSGPPTLQDRFEAFLDGHGIRPAIGPVIVGLSGGVDSTVLLHLLVAAGYGVAGFHVNYALRGEASEEDEAFVRLVCRDLSVSLEVSKAPIDADSTRSESLQQVARDIRYAALRDHALLHSAALVAAGHNRDDQAETVLLNLFRGAGLDGLAGMRFRRPLSGADAVDLVRPLLFASRAEIVTYALAQGIEWREDASNRVSAYRRSALRYEVLPGIEEHFGKGVRKTIARTAELVQEYLAAVAPVVLLPAEQAESDLALGLDELTGADRVWVERLLKGVLERLAPEAPRRAELLHQVFDLISGKVGSFVEVGPVRVSRERTVLRFEHGRSTEQDPEWLIELVPGTSVQTPRGIIRVDILAAVPEARQTATEHVVLVDARVLDERLTVGIWREGDRIRPMGMNGHSKKISDYLTDRKVETTRRRLVPAVRSGDDVIWLAGVGLSHDARLRSDSRGAVLMVFVPMDVPVTS